MKQKTRFNQVKIGDEFEWRSRKMKKVADRRAQATDHRQDFIFSYTDVVVIDVEDVEEDNVDDIYQGFGSIQNLDPYYNYSWQGTKQTP